LVVERVGQNPSSVRITAADLQMEAAVFVDNAAVGSFSVSGSAEGLIH